MTFQIKHARRLAKDHDLQACVVLTVARDGVVTVITYGEDNRKCDAIGVWGQGLWKYAVSIIPFQTVFGWGNNGVPKRVTRDQMAIAGDAKDEQTEQPVSVPGEFPKPDFARAQAQG